MQYLNKLRNTKQNREASSLETIMCAGMWPPARKLEAKLIELAQDVCQFCRQAHVDDYHQYWGCPTLLQSSNQTVSETNYLIQYAVEQHAD